jgi:phage major head subunit gpT-like protein
MSSTFRRDLYPDLFDSAALPALEELFKSELDMHPGVREMIFKKESTSRDIWQYAELHDLPLFSQVAEGTEYSFNRPRAGNNKTFRPKKWGLGISITEEAVEDGRFDFVADMMRKMARSAMESQEINAMNVFNNGFSTETCADGLSVFNSAHTLPGGLTFRNKLAVDSDLSPSVLDTALVDFKTQFVGDTGIIENIRPKYLIVPPSLERYAKEIVGSELKADTANNNMNSLKSEGLQVVVSVHLTDPDAFFITADPSQTGLKIISRKGIETKAAGPDASFKNDTIMYKSRYREDIGVTNAKGILASPGA